MINSLQIGQMGENAAVSYIKSKEYMILDRNYHSRFGEIDIIAKNKNYIVFIEVKTRHETAMVTAFEAVDAFKQKKIIKTAMIYLMKHNLDLQPRFDVIEVIIEKGSGSIKAVNQIENAFLGDGFYETF